MKDKDGIVCCKLCKEILFVAMKYKKGLDDAIEFVVCNNCKFPVSINDLEIMEKIEKKYSIEFYENKSLKDVRKMLENCDNTSQKKE
jgi:hypothetical protein